MVAHLTADQEISRPTGVPGFGCGEFIIDTDANTITYRIAYGGLTSAETEAQIHGLADPGVNGGVLHVLPGGSVKTGVYTYSEDQEAGILAGSAYAHVHTQSNGQGELRGQIVSHIAALDTGQVTTPRTASGRGWAAVMIDKCANTLTYHIEIPALSSAETSAAFHGPALHGSNAAVLHTLPTGPVKAGVWNYPEAIEEQIEDGLLYIKINTAADPQGTIRGQLVSSIAVLDRTQVVNPPPNPSGAVGIAFLSLDRQNFSLGYDVRLFGLGSGKISANLHGYAPPGSGAASLEVLPPGNPKRGTFTFGSSRYLDVLNQRLYFDVHTDANPDGELRGQLNFQRDCFQTGDADYNESVDFADITAILIRFGSNYQLPRYRPANQGDGNYDGIVNFADITATLSRFGLCYR